MLVHLRDEILDRIRKFLDGVLLQRFDSFPELHELEHYGNDLLVLLRDLVEVVACSAGGSAAATAVHAVLAMVFQRVEQMQSMAYLRRSKGIRNLRKRQRIASCYGGVAVAMEVLANIACAFGTYLVMLYWLKFGQRNQVEQLWWLAAACGATILNGVVWGRVRRAMSAVPSLKRCNADLVFVAVLCTTFCCCLSACAAVKL